MPDALTVGDIALTRTLDATALNDTANHPEVRPFLGGSGYLELSPIVGNPANYALTVGKSGFVLICHEPGIYEVHSMFLPEDRHMSHAAMQAGFEYMFTRTDCYRILTRVPDSNKAALGLAKRGGFIEQFHRISDMGPASYMALDIEQWAMRCDTLEAWGQWFHEELEKAKAAAGSTLEVHEDDASHDIAVGACCLMVAAGNAAKGVAFYNRWAKFAGYATITLISQTPPVIDVVDAIVSFDEDIEFLTVRSA